MNCDPRGVKRGACEMDNCDCTAYEYEQEQGAKCSYCFCPPTKHKKLEMDVFQENHQSCSSYLEVIDNGLQNADYEENNVTVIDLFPSPLSTFDTQLQDILPKKLPRQVELALENRSLSPDLRNKIVRIIADRCFSEEVPSKNINFVAELAVHKWSPLKSRYGNSASECLSTQIKRRLAKLRAFKKTNKQEAAKVVESSEMQKFYKDEMAAEMAKQTPAMLKLKQFLDATRTGRQVEVNQLAAQAVLNLYPALKISELLLWEFTKLVKLEENMLIKRWEQFIDAMKDYLKRTENFTITDESYGNLTVQILLKLPLLLPSGKRTNNNTKFVLQLFEANTAISETIPPKSEAPRLIAVRGNEEKNITLYLYVDGCALFTEKLPVRAVLKLLAAYWVFNIQFVPETRPTMLILSTALLREAMPSKMMSKSSAVNCLLQQLQM